jgi:asparagine synthetase B (glutamine-hydrolysing)
VISHLYELFGEGVANMLDGFFAFVLLDQRTKTFYAARDPLGVTCMYIGWGHDGSVWLASEMKCLKVGGAGSGMGRATRTRRRGGRQGSVGAVEDRGA